MKQKLLVIFLTLVMILSSTAAAYGKSTYVVHSGDVLWRIAKDFNLTYEELAKYNKIANPNLIYPGQALKIPDRESAVTVNTETAGTDSIGFKTTADIIIKNGLIYTVDSESTEAQALAIKDGTIIYVGQTNGVDSYLGSSTKVIDLDGGMALPGFIDSHAHPAAGVNELYTLDLSEYSTKEEYIKAVSDYLADNPQIPSIVGFGWRMPAFKGEEPNSKMLDSITAEIPIVLADEGHHVRWLNSKALQIAGISKSTQAPTGALIYRDASGAPTGLLADYPGIAELFTQFTCDQFKEAIKFYQSKASNYGITATFEDFPRFYKEGVAAYRALEAGGELTMRIACYLRVSPDTDLNAKVKEISAEKKKNSASDLFRINGVKIFIDGVLEGKTAYLEEPYLVDPSSVGSYIWEGKTDKLNQLAALADKNGLSLHYHAIGDAAVRTALDSVAYARAQNGPSDIRPGITHIQLVNQTDFKRFAQLGVTAVPQPFWAVYDEYYDQAVEYVGKERADKQYPIESFFKAGVLVSSGSDYPVQTSRPLTAIESGVTRAYPGEAQDAKFLPEATEKATLAQMIESYTINGAIANHLEDEVGSLEVGKKADIVVLDKNLFQLAPNQIASAKERYTIFNGKIVYQAK